MSQLESLLERLHAARPEELEERILELAMRIAETRSGALFIVDEKRAGLLMEFHVADGVRIERPGTFLKRRTDGRPNGIAFWVAEHNEPYNCRDSEQDENYAQYFHDYRSIAGVPIRYQNKVIGVISVADPRVDAYTDEHMSQLGTLAKASSKLLRRLQVYRAWREKKGQGLIIKGLSPEWLEAERRIELAAPTDLPVLIRGESGTGKELAAHAVHYNSARRDGPFVIVNSAAIPEALIESTLFGHEKGAFTGATYARVGEIEKAKGGTLFLDEIGELPPMLQAKLLRVLEQREYLPIGSNARPKRADVRLICATNRPLEQMAAEGTFREDLFYRIGVVTLNLPPLRTFIADNLPILLETFLFEATRKHGRAVRGFTYEAVQAIGAYRFPGNMRELRNAIDQAVVLCESDRIDLSDLPPAIRGAGAAAALTPEALLPVPPASDDQPISLDPGDAVPAGRRAAGWEALLAQRQFPGYAQAKELSQLCFQRDYFSRLMERTAGDVTAAARLAGMSVPSLYRLLKRAGIRKRWR